MFYNWKVICLSNPAKASASNFGVESSIQDMTNCPELSMKVNFFSLFFLVQKLNKTKLIKICAGSENKGAVRVYKNPFPDLNFKVYSNCE